MEHPAFFSHFSIAIVILIAFPASSERGNNNQYTACSQPYKCGNIQGVGYPFWGDNRPQSCGHPSFQLKCQQDGHPVMDIGYQRFMVLNISDSSNTMTTARLDFWNDMCPRTLNNTTLNFSLFDYGKTVQNLSLFYDCIRDTDNVSAPFHFDCQQENFMNASAYYLHESFVGVNEFQKIANECRLHLSMPISNTSLQELYFWKNTTPQAAIDQGFDVVYDPYPNRYSCQTCESSGGTCGSDSTFQFRCFCQDQPYVQDLACEKSSGLMKQVMRIFLPLSLVIAILAVFVSRIIARTVHKLRSKRNQNDKVFLEEYKTLAPRRFSYSEVKKMTNSFKEKLGQGGFSCVYKGKLPSGRFVAVKVLNTSKGNGDEFFNEVASISRTSHVNIVSLLGYYFGIKQRILIYEFMPNGSLEKFISNRIASDDNGHHLEWEKLYQIAVGIARGLEYLHRGCSTRILHFDIKPHNVLLDEEFCPKISDFGLAKLCPKKESIISSMDQVRGTIGYTAPEVFSRNFGAISHKSDVYSYGMMVLEMVGARGDIDVGAGNSSEIYFPHWIYKRLEQGNDLGFHGNMTEEENENMRRIILVGLWCIQTDPLHRPSMSKVIEMLETSAEYLQIPPRTFTSSPPNMQIDASTTPIPI